MECNGIQIETDCKYWLLKKNLGTIKWAVTDILIHCHGNTIMQIIFLLKYTVSAEDVFYFYVENRGKSNWEPVKNFCSEKNRCGRIIMQTNPETCVYIYCLEIYDLQL